MRRFALFLLLSAGAAVSAPLAAPSHATAQEADIVGTWVLDVERSDDVREVMRRARRNRAPDPARGGEARRRRRGGDAGGGPARQASPAARVLQQRLMRPVPALAIAKTDSTYVLSARGQQFAQFFFDGREVETGTGTELEFEIKAEWKGNKLEVETKASGGAKLKQKYEIDRDKDELKVELDYNNSRMSQRFRVKQIYTRRAAG